MSNSDTFGTNFFVQKTPSVYCRHIDCVNIYHIGDYIYVIIFFTESLLIV